MEGKYNNRQNFAPILAQHREWPVVRLSKNRADFVTKVVEKAFEQIKQLKPTTSELIAELELTRYKENLRIKKTPWKVDPEDEIDFWKNIKQQLLVISSQHEQSEAVEDTILRQIIYRYAEEIAGNFKHSYYQLARTVVTFGFARLLNASQSKYFSGLFRGSRTLRDKIRIRGNAELVRKLAKTGTVVMVPTHFSNLDSILIGWVISELGLPPFIYGAGLNLFNMSLFAYFMNSVGAYKVDRRKKNSIYLETLKTYSNEALQEGCHSLFFPGGTRSRSGMIEKKLKLGLLGTAIEAQRSSYAKNEDKKIFIVPVVINYNFVLEAPSLIDQFLEREGQEKYYLETDEYSDSYKITKFLLKFFTRAAEISVSIGHAMDLFGNYVDENGNSFSKNGTQINPRDYFLQGKKITTDKQRDEEYARLLSQRIIEEFHKFNEVLPSHIVAFVAYLELRKQFKELDLYSFLRLPEDEMVVDFSVFRNGIKKVKEALLELESQGKILTGPDFEKDTDSIMLIGLENVGMYHAKRPLLRNDEGDIVTQDLRLLYFYHNRLVGYNLEEYV
jgi:glycerol-3-phosphate O-acyltransferase